MVAEKANKTIGGKSKMNNKSTFLNYEVMKEEISPDNVFAMAEIIAFTEMRYLIGYKGTQMQKTYIDLYKDILNKNAYKRNKKEVQQDYEQCDKIVESLNLTKNMRVALECRMAGLSYPEIGRILERAQATVYEYFIKMRQRCTAIYG